MTQEITLNDEQEAAITALVTFMLTPEEVAFKLTGYSGTGKSTMVRTFLDRLPGLMKIMRLTCPDLPDYEIALTATTNKAAENFALLSGMDVKTIHSFLGLRVNYNFETGKSNLIPKDQVKKAGYLLFIDEYSYIDAELLGYIFKRTENCKIIFIGDPAQLTPVMSSDVPVAKANFSEAQLTKMVRQPLLEDGTPHPVSLLSEQFRQMVITGEPFTFIPDGVYVQHLDRPDFMKAVEAEFTRPDWHSQDSRVLSWTNKTAITANNHVRSLITGDPDFKKGDYAICNQYLQVGIYKFKTDQTVCITSEPQPTERYGVAGKNYRLDGSSEVFVPDLLAAKVKFISSSRAAGEYRRAEEAENKWGDLRAAAAGTINKAQGSTHDRVFIDLDDIARCNSMDQVARMLYVGTSRARHQVFYTGDLA